MVLPCHRGITYHGDGLLSWYAVTPTRMPSAEMAASTLRHIAHKIRSCHSIFRISAVRLLAPTSSACRCGEQQLPQQFRDSSPRRARSELRPLLHRPDVVVDPRSLCSDGVRPALFCAGHTVVGRRHPGRRITAPASTAHTTTQAESVLGLRSLNDYAESAGATTSWFGNAWDCRAADKPRSEALSEPSTEASTEVAAQRGAQ